MKTTAVVSLLAATLAVTGCGSGSMGTATGGSTPGMGAAAPSARNLAVDAAVRSQLVAAGAALHHLKSADYTGLVKGETFYAYVPSTKTFWAGAGLVASPSSTRAQVGDQDDGAFLDFERRADGTWHAYPAGIPGSTQFTCAVAIPASVLAVWGWPSGTCHPPA